MKTTRYLLLYIALLCGIVPPVRGQIVTNSNKTQSLPGTIRMPSLISIQVSNNSTSLTVENIEEEQSFPSLYTVSVISNIPWDVNVNAASDYLVNTGTDEHIPVSIIKLKSSSSSSYISLSRVPQSIAVNENNDVQSSFSVDVKIAATQDKPGGNYSAAIFFTVSPQ